MTRRPPPLIVTGGQLWETTAQLVADLAGREVSGQLPDLLVWDERDVDERWVGRPSTFVVRDRPLRRVPAEHGRAALGAKAGDVELRAYLWRRRVADVALVGRIALQAAPWLPGHQGRRAWLATPDDGPALASGLEIPPAGAGGPQHLVTTDLELARSAAAARDPRHRWQPGFWATPPAATARPEILAWGLPDRRQGFDLVGRALAGRSNELRSLGARVRWVSPPEAVLLADEVDDLRRAGVDDLIELVPSPDPEGMLREHLPGAAALLLCGRPGAAVPGDETLVRAYRSGVRTIGFGPAPATDLALDDRWTLPPFADVTAVGEALVAAVRASAEARLPGPVGIEALFDRLEADDRG